MAFLPGLFLLCSIATATVGYDGQTWQVVTAAIAPKGHFYISTPTRIYFKNEIITRSTERIFGETFWLIQSGAGLIYGVSDHLELGLLQLIYQDAHRPRGSYNLPDDLFLHGKAAIIGDRSSRWRFSTRIDLRLPTAPSHNLILENYASDRPSLGIRLIGSFISRPDASEKSLNLHGNLGYVIHADRGTTLSHRPQDLLPVTANTREVTFGVGADRSFSHWGLFIELYGRLFHHRPPITAYTRENILYVAPGLYFSANDWLKLRLALDLRLLGGRDLTLYNGDGGSLTRKLWLTVPNLPDWRFNFAAVFSLNGIFKPARKEFSPPPQVVKKEIPIVDQFVLERLKNEKTENELLLIEAERQRMKDLMERLRKILEPAPQPPSTEPAPPTP